MCSVSRRRSQWRVIVMWCMVCEVRSWEEETRVSISLSYWKAPRWLPSLTSAIDGQIAINSIYVFTSPLLWDLWFNPDIYGTETSDWGSVTPSLLVPWRLFFKLQISIPLGIKPKTVQFLHHSCRCIACIACNEHLIFHTLLYPDRDKLLLIVEFCVGSPLFTQITYFSFKLVVGNVWCILFLTNPNNKSIILLEQITACSWGSWETSLSVSYMHAGWDDFSLFCICVHKLVTQLTYHQNGYLMGIIF